ncbi:MAG TPA: fumarylacetoacetate hydrolase family protein [Acidimicrobiales bacterium]|nr:fumarylacetoacetate hydrolase family protein [Acidimicrobiales bacterium]
MTALVMTTDGPGRVEGDELALLEAPTTPLGVIDLPPTATVRARVAVAEATLLAPVPRPGKVWAVGLNYRAHAAESGREPPPVPMVFIKTTQSVVGSGADIVLPTIAATQVDWECELAVVIGRRASSVKAADAWSYVAGITACNDVSARDVQFTTNNFGLAKSFDTFTPLGGSMVTLDEYENPDDVGVRTLVNGETKQSSRTSDMVFSVGELIEYLSAHTTLEPGDVISTGTPEGVGMARGEFLAAGDVVTIEVDGVLPLVNRVVAAS